MCGLGITYGSDEDACSTGLLCSSTAVADLPEMLLWGGMLLICNKFHEHCAYYMSIFLPKINKHTSIILMKWTWGSIVSIGSILFLAHCIKIDNIIDSYQHTEKILELNMLWLYFLLVCLSNCLCLFPCPCGCHKMIWRGMNVRNDKQTTLSKINKILNYSPAGHGISCYVQ